MKTNITVYNLPDARKIDKSNKYHETIIYAQNNTWFGFCLDDALNNMRKHNPHTIPQSFEFRRWI